MRSVKSLLLHINTCRGFIPICDCRPSKSHDAIGFSKLRTLKASGQGWKQTAGSRIWGSGKHIDGEVFSNALNGENRAKK